MQSSLRSATRSVNAGGRIPKAKKSKRKVVHMIFQRCLPFCRNFFGGSEQLYWEDIFDNMSKNIFPYGFKYRDGSLIFQGSNSKISLKDVGPRTCQDIIIFMKKHGIISDLDQQNAYDHHMNESCEIRSVSDIKKRPLERRTVFMTYASYIAEKIHRVYGGSVFELKDNAFSTIQDAYQIELITINDITFKNGVIVDIPRLTYNREIGFFIADGVTVDETGKIHYEMSSVFNKLSKHLETSNITLLPDNDRQDYKLWDIWLQQRNDVQNDSQNDVQYDQDSQSSRSSF